MHLHADEFVFHPTRPDWGVGQVLGELEGRPKWYRVFFRRAGEKEVNTANVALARVGIPEPIEDLRDMTGPRWRAAHHCVYVVELEDTVLDVRAFAGESPRHDPDLSCLYVGSTGLTPEERFENHRAGHKGNRFVRDYGVRLRPDLYEGLDGLPWELAQRVEEVLARHLRSRGHAVWQR